MFIIDSRSSPAEGCGFVQLSSLLHVSGIDFDILDLDLLFVFFFFQDFGFEVPDKFLVGYALDYNEYFRDLNVSILE